MKKGLLLGFALLSLIACNDNEAPKENLHLTGNVKGLSQGKLYIKKFEDTTLVAIDSIIIKGNSHFETTFPLKKPEVFYLFLDRGQTNSIDNNLVFFAEPGEMNIETSLKEFYAAAKITGSKNQELFELNRNEKHQNVGLHFLCPLFGGFLRKQFFYFDLMRIFRFLQ